MSYVSNIQCCQIPLLVAKLATFESLWRIFFGARYFEILLLFGLLFKICQKTGLNRFQPWFFGLCVDIFDFSEAFDVGLLRFQSCFDVDLLGFSKIWLLLSKTQNLATFAQNFLAVLSTEVRLRNQCLCDHFGDFRSARAIFSTSKNRQRHIFNFSPK